MDHQDVGKAVSCMLWFTFECVRERERERERLGLLLSYQHCSGGRAGVQYMCAEPQ